MRGEYHLLTLRLLTVRYLAAEITYEGGLHVLLPQSDKHRSLLMRRKKDIVVEWDRSYNKARLEVGRRPLG
jgi:hypothetical protein